jgi:hypothetical protein
MFEPELTPQGEQRREAILRLMKEAASQRRRRRHIMRAVGVCAVLALTVPLTIRLMHSQTARVASPAIEIARTSPAPVETSPPPAPVRPTLVIGTIETDPTILSRWSVTPVAKSADRVQLITDDDDLIHTLADAGQSAGIIQIGDQAMLVASP